MNFNDAYMQLEDEFRERVAEDHRQWKFESVYLPNMAPEAPVDYVLIGMEPSLGTWSGKKEQDINERMRKAQEKIDDGFRNFCGVWTLHHPVKEYLCREGEAYYVTDLAKGAMLTSSPGAGDDKKYDAWYPLLEKELGLVAKPDAKIISIGHRVSRFLSEKNVHSHAGTVPTTQPRLHATGGRRRIDSRASSGSSRVTSTRSPAILASPAISADQPQTHAMLPSVFPARSCSSSTRSGSTASGTKRLRDGDRNRGSGRAS